MFRNTCIICGSANIETIIDLGMHPFADTFVSEARQCEPDCLYPLTCGLCLACGHIQTMCITDPLARYAQHDYSYTSSNSAFSRSHWQSYAIEISRRLDLAPREFRG